jgi:hypothetical protein
MKSFVVITLLLFGSQVYGQVLSKQTALSASDQKTEAGADQEFEAYCLQHALQLFTVPAGKSTDNLKIAGEVTLLDNPKATYRDYGIALKENETQYYRIAGSEQLLMVNSLYRLRVAFNAGNNIKTTR